MVEPEARPPRYTPEPATDGPGLRTILTIANHGECRWPIGDALAPDFTLCGAECGEAVYCPEHHRRGHKAPATNAQRRAAAAMRAAKARKAAADAVRRSDFYSLSDQITTTGRAG